MSDVGFDEFWSTYPRKVGKVKALLSWRRLKPDLAVVLAALAWQVTQPQWRAEGGRFIPHPVTWLNQGRWADEPFHLPNSTTVDWSDECKQVHNGACSGQYAHGIKMRPEAE